MTEDTSVHAALAFCDPRGTYCRHAAVTIASIFENAKSLPVCVHILHDETLTDFNRNALTSLASRPGREIRFHDVGKFFESGKIDVSRLTADGAKGMLFRLFLPDVIEADQVIYLDCDIVVQMDIAELWRVPLGDRAVAAVRDVWALDCLRGKDVPWRLGKVWDLMGVAHDSYFNAGVLVMNLRKIREKYDFMRLVEEFYARFRKCITLADQDCLNWIFAKDKLLIDERFNRIDASGATEESLDGSIWHMAGGSAKPWTSYTRPLVDDLYWRYLRLTPYCASENELIRLMLTGFASSPLMHVHSSSCWRRLLKQIEDNICRGHIWTLPHIFLALARQRLGLDGNREIRGRQA